MKGSGKALLLLFVFFFLAMFAVAQTNTPNTPFQHVIIVVQENRTPDNLFGSDLYNNPRRLPNAHLASQGLCGLNQEVPLTALNLDTCANPDHSHSAQSQRFWGAWEKMYDKGNMDGGCNNKTYVTGCNGQYPSCYNSGTCPYTYVDNTPRRPQYQALASSSRISRSR